MQPPSATIRVATVDRKAQQEEFRYDDTFDIGIYLLRMLQAVRPVQVAFSVNVDPEESRPEKIDRKELQKQFGEIPLVFAEDRKTWRACSSCFAKGGVCGA